MGPNFTEGRTKIFFLKSVTLFFLKSVNLLLFGIPTVLEYRFLTDKSITNWQNREYCQATTVFITQVTNSNTVGIFDLDKLFNNGTEMGKTENDTDD